MVDSINGTFIPVRADIISRKRPQRPDQILRERTEQRRIVREEMRFQELRKKAETKELTKDEKAELAFIEMNRIVEKMAERPPVCYLA